MFLVRPVVADSLPNDALLNDALRPASFIFRRDRDIL